METVDDTDSRLAYTGWWFTTHSVHEYNISAHGTGRAGSSITFTFRGTSVNVYGTLGTSTSVASYALDQSSPSEVAFSASPSTMYQYPMYSSPILIDEEHTLVIVTMDRSDFFCFDFLEYTPSLPQSAWSLRQSGSSSTVPEGGASLSTSSSQSSGDSSGVSKAGIAGTVIAVFIFAFTLFVVAFLLYRRKAKKAILVVPASVRPMNVFGSEEFAQPAPVRRSFMLHRTSRAFSQHDPECTTELVRGSGHGYHTLGLGRSRVEGSVSQSIWSESVLESAHGLSQLQGYLPESNQDYEYPGIIPQSESRRLDPLLITSCGAR